MRIMPQAWQEKGDRHQTLVSQNTHIYKVASLVGMAFIKLQVLFSQYCLREQTQLHCVTFVCGDFLFLLLP